MEDRWQRNIRVFHDTQAFYTENEQLQAAVQRGRADTRLYGADEYPGLPIQGTAEELMRIADDPDGSLAAQASAAQALRDIKNGAACDPVRHAGKITISRDKTINAALRLYKTYPQHKIAVLNFASATTPGGGVKKGSSAQEESLCRCSTLYPTLDRRWLWQQYYDENRAAHDIRYTDAVIYTPDVLICKSDDDPPVRLSEAEFVPIDVLTCAAPNLRNMPREMIDENVLFELYLKRIQHILHIAAANRVEVLVLGAFGCGAFRNDPVLVAKAFVAALVSYRNRFELVEFAIYCNAHESENYSAFSEMISLHF